MSDDELDEHDKTRILCCLFREAVEHREASLNAKNEGFPGIAFLEMAEGYALMKIREKIRKMKVSK